MINREELKAELEKSRYIGLDNGKMESCGKSVDLSVIHKAAALLLEISDPEFVPDKELINALCKWFSGSRAQKAVARFRAMMSALVEG